MQRVTVEFGYVGPHPQSVTVPAGAIYADVRVIGGHGGAAEAGTCCVYVGGDGAQISGRLPVTGGEVLQLNVAQCRHGHGVNNRRAHLGARTNTRPLSPITI